MKLIVSNLALIDYAEINIDGITILAGENDTGKSTIGKTLFSLHNSMYKFEEQVRDERIRRLTSFLSFCVSSLISERSPLQEFDIVEFAFRLLYEVDKGEFIVNSANLKSYLNEILEKNNIKHKKTFAGINDLIEQIQRTLTVSDDRILQTIIQKTFTSELGNTLNNVFSEKEQGRVSYTNGISETRININPDNIVEISTAASLDSNIILIDNPYILDEISNSFISRRPGSISSIRHRSQLVKLLTETSDETEMQQAFDEIIVQDQINEIFSMIDAICDGELYIGEQKGSYKSSAFTTPLDIKSISSGLKTFAILKTLLKKQVIKKNTIIILDEPEIHLHPKWQVSLAEILVLMQKSFNIKLLITSHSPYFIDAIETYSMVFDLVESCNYYLAERRAGGAVIFNCNGETSKIYNKLALPFKTLERLRIQYEK